MLMEALRTYLENETQVPFRVGPEVPEMPDVLGIVTTEPGQGYVNDGLFEVVGFRVQVRGGQNRHTDVEAYARQVDRLIEYGDYPHERWGSWVITAYRSSGGPTPAPLDNGRRVIYSCSYLAQEATDL